MQMMQVAPSHTQKKAKECNEENIKPHTIKKIKKMYIWWSQRYKKKSEWKQNDNKKMQKNKLEEIQKEIFQVFHTNERFRFGLMLGSFFFLMRTTNFRSSQHLKESTPFFQKKSFRFMIIN